MNKVFLVYEIYFNKLISILNNYCWIPLLKNIYFKIKIPFSISTVFKNKILLSFIFYHIIYLCPK